MTRGIALVAAAAVALALGCGDARPVKYRSAADCSRCHGSPANPAPPRSIRGDTSTEVIEVGAHQLHLRDTPIRAALACSECHVVPLAVGDPGHLDGPHARITWGALAMAGGAAPSWNRDARTCSGVYCHGATLRAPPASPPVWTYSSEPPLAPPSTLVCGGCHGHPPPPPHPRTATCQGCHPLTVRSDGNIHVAGGHHIDGRLDIGTGTGGLGCALCHGYPPATGAHAAHVAFVPDPGSGNYGSTSILQDLFPTATATSAPPAYFFDCGSCHPLDPAKHMDGSVEVELQDAAAPAGSLKARSAPGATYDAPGGTCSGVYCHSGGQETPVYVTTPAWASGAKLGCTGCHDNPPRYPSGGAGTATANTHVVLADDGWELGHFLGLPGPWHTSKHGGGWSDSDDASAITCQTCHSDTVDPSNTGPSGFYYLDTTGTYQLAGGDPSRVASPLYLRLQCSACHSAGGKAAPGSGRVLPLRHVNGSRDVVFDPRSTLPAIAWLPPAPNTPTLPNWVTNGNISGWPASVAFNGTTASFSLAGAGYDPATKTCSNVACHVQQTQVTWGVAPVGQATCVATCHQF